MMCSTYVMVKLTVNPWYITINAYKNSALQHDYNSALLVYRPVIDLVIRHFTGLQYASKESCRPVKIPSLHKAYAIDYGNYF